jgi:putative ABC transport system permease protein
VRTNHIAADLFDVLEVPLVAGRKFTEADATEGSTAVIIDQVMAAALGGGDLIGRTFRYVPDGGAPESGRTWEVVGVVRAFADNFTIPSTFDESPGHVFHAAPVGHNARVSLIVRFKGNAELVGRRITDLAAAVDPIMRIEERMTVVEKWKRDQMAFWAMGLGIWITMMSVLLLSAAGIYAMMSFTVARRRREIGIRAALGANARSVLTAIFARAGRQLGTGIAAGLIVAMAAEISQPGMVLGGNGRVILPVVVFIITGVGFFAALGPARRGLSVQPTDVLRDS